MSFHLIYHVAALRSLSLVYGSIKASARAAASGAGSVAFIDDYTADRSNKTGRMQRVLRGHPGLRFNQVHQHLLDGIPVLSRMTIPNSPTN